MTRFDPSPGTLRLLGCTTLASVFGLGWLAARIPQWREPEMTLWTATIPVEEGVRGLEPGGRVLIGGYPRGRILSVDVIDGVHDTRGRPLVGIDFELPREIELGQDAIVRRSVGIAGTNGVLDISDPGSRDRLFGAERPRVIAIDTSPPSGGPIGVLIGRRNGERIQAIAQAGARFGELMPKRLRMITTAAQDLLDDAEALESQISRGTDQEVLGIQRIMKRVAALGEKSSLFPSLLDSAKADLDVLLGDIEQEVRDWSPVLERIMRGSEIAGQDVAAMSRRLDELAPRLRTARHDLESAMQDAESAWVRIRLLAPEASEVLQRTMARMVLAGGQLRRALNDVLPLAVQAITITPDRRSLSRRRLLESVNDVMGAITDVRDAARRLETVARLADERPSAAFTFDAESTAELDARVADFERLLDALEVRLQTEIEADEGR